MTLKWKRANKTETTNEWKQRFDWFIERIQTRVAFGWLSEHSGKKTSCPKNFLEINRCLALTLYCNTIGQSNNAFSIRVLFGGKTKRQCFDLFIHKTKKTNNEHLPKPFFKVIRKSLYHLTSSHNPFPWLCTDFVWRKLMLVTLGTLG